MRTTTLAAYLLGHLDGLGEDLKIVPQVRCRLAESSYAPFVERLADAPRTPWSSRETIPRRLPPAEGMRLRVLAAASDTVTRLSMVGRISKFRSHRKPSHAPVRTRRGADAEWREHVPAMRRCHRPASTGIFQDFGIRKGTYYTTQLSSLKLRTFSPDGSRLTGVEPTWAKPFSLPVGAGEPLRIQNSRTIHEGTRRILSPNNFTSDVPLMSALFTAFLGQHVCQHHVKS